jgi:serine O-acetyltransferase
MFKRIKEDIKMAQLKDPAAKSKIEILFCYSGIHAIWIHLISHKLWNKNLFFLSRFIAHINRFLTGIEIHPAAQIGDNVFIDHGMGVVIGETTIIGNNVLIYQGVVLGGTSMTTEKRHPTVEEGVVIGAGAIVIGNINIGKDAKIGAGAVVLKDVPSQSTVVGVPGKVAYEDKKQEVNSQYQNLPDPVDETLKLILEKQEKIEEELRILKNKN